MIKKKRRWGLAICAVMLIVMLIGFNQQLKIVRYTLDTGKLPQPIRLALITDLHSCAYGQDMGDLLSAIDSQSPDAILLGGDIFDDVLAVTNTVKLLQGLSGRYPCYYVTGNHEYWSGQEAFQQMMGLLETCGVIRLQGDAVLFEKGDSRIYLCGVDDPSAWKPGGEYGHLGIRGFQNQLEKAAAGIEGDAYTVLLTHRPEQIELYRQYDFDLVLAGHAHGGQWRIPGLLNGVFAPNQGLFPEYAGGRYDLGDVNLIVSRGLARETTRVPRFFNRPELVILQLQ